jgi:hypothetical protein
VLAVLVIYLTLQLISVITAVINAAAAASQLIIVRLVMAQIDNLLHLIVRALMDILIPALQTVNVRIKLSEYLISFLSSMLSTL